MKDMSFDRSLARCSFCGRRPPEVRRMVAGPGAAYICDACLQLCNEILQDTAPFSAKALELTDDANQAVYQGSARFSPLPSADSHVMTVRAADPLAQFGDSPPNPWQFEITF